MAREQKKLRLTGKILVASGPNLDLLGRREPEVYGHDTLSDIERNLHESLPSLCAAAGVEGLTLEFFQTNCEGKMLDQLSAESWAGVLINPGAWTHTSLALADRLAGLELSFVEVHLSNISAREAFRKHSYLAPLASGVVYGLGPSSYRVGLLGLLESLRKKVRP